MVSYYSPLKKHYSLFDLVSTTPFFFQKSFFNFFNYSSMLYENEDLQQLLFLCSPLSSPTKIPLKLLFLFESFLLFPYSVQKNFSFYDFSNLQDCNGLEPYFLPQTHEKFYFFIIKNLGQIYNYFFSSFASSQIKNYSYNFSDMLSKRYLPNLEVLILEPKYTFYSVFEKNALPSLFFFYFKLFNSSFSESFFDIFPKVFNPLKLLAFEKFSDSA